MLVEYNFFCNGHDLSSNHIMKLRLLQVKHFQRAKSRELAKWIKAKSQGLVNMVLVFFFNKVN